MYGNQIKANIPPDVTFTAYNSKQTIKMSSISHLPVQHNFTWKPDRKTIFLIHGSVQMEEFRDHILKGNCIVVQDSTEML